MVNKKGQSMIVSTVLLVLITVSVVVIIVSFVVPFVRNNISESDCFDFIDKFEIVDNNKYSCFDLDESETNPLKKMRIQVLSKVDRAEYGGLQLVVNIDGNSKSFLVYENGRDEKVNMFDKLSGVELPGINEGRTYEIFDKDVVNNNLLWSSKPSSMSVHAILTDGRICDSSDKVLFVETCKN